MFTSNTVNAAVNDKIAIRHKGMPYKLKQAIPPEADGFGMWGV